MKKILITALILINILILFTSTGQPETVQIDVPYYAQGKDTPWADEVLGNNSTVTIRSHGCALTAISMIYSYHLEKELTPSKMNVWLKKHDGFEDAWENGNHLGQIAMNWPVLSGYEDGWVYTRVDWKVQPADLLLIKYYLDNKIPVIAEVTYKSAPHYVVLKGYDELGFFMNDPEFPDEHNFEKIYDISDKWGSGPSRNINGIRVLYPGAKR